MAEFFSPSNLFTLLMIILLQAVLGFDNLLYVSIESKRAPEDRQLFVRRMGVGLAIFFRIGLLFLVSWAIGKLEAELFPIHWTGVVEAKVSGHSLIVLGGGIFILWTAMREILHMLSIEHIDHSEKKSHQSVGRIIGTIVVMNMVFSFDSILSAQALSKNLATITVAIVFSGLLMIYLADTVAEFLKKNRMYEVLGLFILFLVGVMLIAEGGHIAHLTFFGEHITPMKQTTFYFIIAILVAIDIVQGRYKKKIQAQRKAELAHSTEHWG